MRRVELPLEEVRVPGALIAENAHAVVHPRDVGVEEQRVTVLVRRGGSRQPLGPRSEDDSLQVAVVRTSVSQMRTRLLDRAANSSARI